MEIAKKLKISETRYFIVIMLLYWSALFFTMELRFQGVLFSSQNQLLAQSLNYLLGFVISIFLRLLYNKININDRSMFYTISIILLLCFVSGILWEIITKIIINLVKSSFFGFSVNNFLKAFFYNRFITTYQLFLWSSIYIGIQIYNNTIEQKIKYQQALSNQKTANLESLRYQINPAFLFDSLGLLKSMLIKNDNDAEKIISSISEFLKYSLTPGENNKALLSKEIKILQHYYEILNKKNNNKILLKTDIAPETENMSIPVFLILPLFDNAVKYGLLTCSGQLKIDVTTSLNGNKLVLEITNSGCWVDGEPGEGIKNTHKRLQLVYGDYYNFEIIKENDKITSRITI